MANHRHRDTKLRQRLAVYVPLALVILVILAATWVFRRPTFELGEGDWLDIDYAALPEVDLLRRYIQIDTSATTGSEIAGAEFLAAELRKIGLDPRIERFGDRHANLWAVLEGRSPEALVLHSHIDVYPVEEPEAWDFPPFGAEIDAAWLYGRGVFDMKSVTIVQLLTLREILASGRTPEKSIIFLATGSEEVGSEMGARWILEEHAELSSRFWAVLTEGGIVEPISRTSIKYWGIEFAQKQFATGFLCAPTREELEAVRDQIVAWRDAVELLEVTEESETFLASYAPTRDNPLYRAALEDPDRTRVLGTMFAQLPPYLQSQFRNEIVPFDPEAAPDGGFRMKIMFHLLPGEKLEETRARLLPPWLLLDLPFTLGPVLGSDRGSPVEHPVFENLVAEVRRAYPKATVGPYLLPWSATDSRYFRQAGIPSYGFSPFVIFSTDTFRVDGVNERISLPGYLSGFDLYREAVRRIVN
jgi:acetylornithine deacetylase/succinyl-diaminopimelate desuccinylase-like protein